MTIFLQEDVATTPLTAWYDYVLPHLKGITPGAAALLAIREAATEYFRRARTYEVAHPPIDLVATQREYALNPGAGLVMIEPKAVYINLVEIDNESEDYIKEKFGHDWKTKYGTPNYFFCPAPNRIVLASPPDVGGIGALTMEAIVTLGASAAAVPSILFENQDSRLGVAAGAIANLAISPDKPYTNPAVAEAARHTFERSAGAADAIRVKGGGKAPLRSSVIHGVK